jgi:hypothetical protein
MAGTLSKRQQARNEKMLQELVQNVPGNNFCADCQARNPGASCLVAVCFRVRDGLLTSLPYHSLGFMERTYFRQLGAVFPSRPDAQISGIGRTGTSERCFDPIADKRFL